MGLLMALAPATSIGLRRGMGWEGDGSVSSFGMGPGITGGGSCTSSRGDFQASNCSLFLGMHPHASSVTRLPSSPLFQIHGEEFFR